MQTILTGLTFCRVEVCVCLCDQSWSIEHLLFRFVCKATLIGALIETGTFSPQLLLRGSAICRLGYKLLVISVLWNVLPTTYLWVLHPLHSLALGLVLVPYRHWFPICHPYTLAHSFPHSHINKILIFLYFYELFVDYQKRKLCK